MCMTDLLNVELHNHNLKQVDQAWEEMFLSSNKNMGGELLETIPRTQKVNAHEERFVVVSHGFSFQKGTEERQKSASHRQRYSRRSQTKSIDLPEGALSRWRR